MTAFTLTETHLFVTLRNSKCFVYDHKVPIKDPVQEINLLGGSRCDEILVLSYAKPCKILFACSEEPYYCVGYGADAT